MRRKRDRSDPRSCLHLAWQSCFRVQERKILIRVGSLPVEEMMSWLFWICTCFFLFSGFLPVLIYKWVLTGFHINLFTMNIFCSDSSFHILSANWLYYHVSGVNLHLSYVNMSYSLFLASKCSGQQLVYCWVVFFFLSGLTSISKTLKITCPCLNYSCESVSTLWTISLL